jgi:hypothetical protein
VGPTKEALRRRSPPAIALRQPSPSGRGARATPMSCRKHGLPYVRRTTWPCNWNITVSGGSRLLLGLIWRRLAADGQPTQQRRASCTSITLKALLSSACIRSFRLRRVELPAPRSAFGRFGGSAFAPRRVPGPCASWRSANARPCAAVSPPCRAFRVLRAPPGPGSCARRRKCAKAIVLYLRGGIFRCALRASAKGCLLPTLSANFMIFHPFRQEWGGVPHLRSPTVS